MTGAAPIANPDALLELRAVSTARGAGRAATFWRSGRRGADAHSTATPALDRVDLTLTAGEVVGLLGESTAGGAMVGRVAVGLVAPCAGERFYDGERITDLRSAAARRARLALQMLLADAPGTLDPRQRIVDVVGEAPVAQRLIGRRQQVEYVGLMLNRVGVDPLLMRHRPHEFSAGQRARIGIARAIAVRPRVLVANEVLAPLEITERAQVLNLLADLRLALELTCLVVSRDVATVRHAAQRTVVMYLGRVIERAGTAELLARPNHPYTKALLAHDGNVVPGRRVWATHIGEAPSPLHPPRGCHYHPRCPVALPRCREVAPALVTIAPGHDAACHLNDRA